MKRLNHLFDKLLYIGTAISSLSFFVIVVIAVASRYIFKAPILASIEMSRVLFVWSCFLAAALTYRRGAHVSITYIFDKFPKRLQRGVALLLHLLILAFMAIVLYQSLIVTGLLWPSRLPMLQISQSWFYIPVPIIAVIMISYTLEFLIHDIRPSQQGEV